MAVFLYPNGLTEEFKPQQHTFTDKELYEFFNGFDKIRSFRLYEVPATWCVWGERNPINSVPDEFNQVGTDILDQPCYSPVLFIHDTEIDPAWRMTDEIIVSGYEEFKNDLSIFFNEIAKIILEEREEKRTVSGQPQNLMVLEQSAVSADKRIIFRFDIDKQIAEFFSEPNLNEFGVKVLDYLRDTSKIGDIFSIYADKNIIIIVDDAQVEPFIEKIVAYFQHQEKYEACSDIRLAYTKWVEYKESKKKKPRKKRGPKKSDDSKSGN
jgi:hypothetical protein